MPRDPVIVELEEHEYRCDECGWNGLLFAVPGHSRVCPYCWPRVVIVRRLTDARDP